MQTILYLNTMFALFYPEERRERTHFVCAWQIGLLQFNTDIIYCYVCIQICIPSYCKCRSDIQFLFVRCLNLSFFISLEVYWLFFVVWLYWIYVFFECLSVFFQIDSVCLSTCRFVHCLSFCLLNSVWMSVCRSMISNATAQSGPDMWIGVVWFLTMRPQHPILTGDMGARIW